MSERSERALRKTSSDWISRNGCRRLHSLLNYNIIPLKLLTPLGVASVSSNSDSDAGDSMDIDDNDNSGRRRSNRNAGDLKIGNSVLTAYGVGAITQFRPADSTYMVELTNWKLANNQTVFAYFSREALLSSEKSSKKSPIKFNKRKVSSGRKIPELSAHQEFSSQFCGVEIGDSSDDGGPDEAYFMDNYRSIAEKNAYHEVSERSERALTKTRIRATTKQN